MPMLRLYYADATISLRYRYTIRTIALHYLNDIGYGLLTAPTQLVNRFCYRLR